MNIQKKGGENGLTKVTFGGPWGIRTLSSIDNLPG
jgi:hypothetical protein